MARPSPSTLQPLRLLAVGAFLCLAPLAPFALTGCAVVAVGAAAVSVTATAVGVAADVAVGTAKLAGKGVGAAYNAATDDKPDNSGISIKYRQSDPQHPYQPGPGASNARDTATEPNPSAAPPPPAAAPAPRVESVPIAP